MIARTSRFRPPTCIPPRSAGGDFVLARGRFASRAGRLGTLVAALVIGFALAGRPVQASPIVHPGDTLGVNVLNYAAVIDDSQGRLKGLASDSIVVAGDGSISIPVVGTMHVAGKTTQAISKIIAGRLASYVRDPAVNVELIAQSQQIFLTGSTVGSLPFLPGETLSSALGQLRSQLQKDAPSSSSSSGDKYGDVLARSVVDLRRIAIERDAKLSEPIDGDALLRSGLPGPSLVPGDTLRLVSKPIRVDVRGQVAAPGTIYLYPDDTLETALLSAGGPLGSASTVDAALVRDGREQPLPLGGAGLREPPANGDTIIVRAAPHVTVLGQVASPGEFLLKNGSSLLIALYVAGGPTRWGNVRDVEVMHAGARRSYDLRALQHGDLDADVPLADGDIVYVPEGHKIDPRLFFSALGAAISNSYDVTHW
jgi:protein involved in polysaccharide export with SLBB domain